MAGGTAGPAPTYPFPNTNAGDQPTGLSSYVQPAQQTGGLQNWQARQQAMQQQRQQYRQHLKDWYNSRPRFGQQPIPAPVAQTSVTPAPVAPTPMAPTPVTPAPIPTGISSIPTTPTAPTPMPVAVAPSTPIVPPAAPVYTQPTPTAPPPGSFQALRAGGLATLRRS
jgi:hypothetical protein